MFEGAATVAIGPDSRNDAAKVEVWECMARIGLGSLVLIDRRLVHRIAVVRTGTYAVMCSSQKGRFYGCSRCSDNFGDSKEGRARKTGTSRHKEVAVGDCERCNYQGKSHNRLLRRRLIPPGDSNNTVASKASVGRSGICTWTSCSTETLAKRVICTEDLNVAQSFNDIVRKSKSSRFLHPNRQSFNSRRL
jgi:hypothetical protein